MIPTPMSPTYAAVMKEYEIFTGRESGDNIDPLLRAVLKHFRSGMVLLPEVAPCLAICSFAVEEFDYSFVLRWFIRYVIWFCKLYYRGRPMWNDFLMALWQLSRDPRYIVRMAEHFKSATTEQKSTGAWMVNSVCQQDPEFADYWNDLGVVIS